MKKPIFLLFLTAMMLAFSFSACAAELFYDLDAMGQYIRSCDDALKMAYTVRIAKGATGSMSKDDVKNYIFDCTGLGYYFTYSIDSVSVDGIPCWEVDLQVEYRPSVAILRAYKSGKTSSLTSEEKQVLDIAKGIVKQAKQQKGALAQERFIHDEIIRRVDYVSHDGISENDRKRMHGCVGALLDGRANCQGFSDAFYLLGSMLGMNVRIMNNTFQNKDAHTWNAIEVNGKWYMVDVTYDNDSAVFDEKVPHYAYFNFAEDMAGKTHVFDAAHEPGPIERSSSSYYFYYYGSTPYGAAFTDLESLARYCYRQRVASTSNKYVYVMLLGRNIDNINDIHNALKTATNNHNGRTSWYVNYQNKGNHCYITVRWDEF